MSELTSCNYCSLRRIRASAKEHGLKVTLLPSEFMEGTEVYTHPKDVIVSMLSKEEREQHWSSWMMEITGSCCC